MIRTLLISLAVFLGVVGTGFEAHAEWKPITQGRYTYWESGYDQAFPISMPGITDVFYYKVRGAEDNQWSFYTPTSEDAQTREILYRVLFTDGARIFERTSTQNFWTEWADCDLPAMKAFFNQQFQQAQSQAQTDFRSYFIAKYFEAERLFHACQQMKLRNGR